jgi:LysM repeat protein
VNGLFKLLSSVFGQSSTAVSLTREEEVTAALGHLRDFLNGGTNPIVRVYADKGGGFGQQAAAVRVLDRLFAPADATVPGLAYTGDGTLAEIVYADDAASTVVNLRQLLGWAPDQNQGAYNGGSVRLVPWANRAQLQQATVALSGASDPDANIAGELRVDYYLRLQPFLYTHPDELQTRAPASVIDLATAPGLGGESFHYRALYLSVPDQIKWSDYTSRPDPVGRRAHVLQYLVDNMQGQNGPRYALLWTYGIHTTTYPGSDELWPSAISTFPYDQVTQLVVGVMATQETTDGPVAGALPAVIVNLGNFWFDAAAGGTQDDRFKPVKDYLAGGLTAWETGIANSRKEPPLTPLQKKTFQVKAARASYFARVNAANRVRFEADTGVDSVEPAVEEWLLTATGGVASAQKVLWVQLGRMPAQVSDYVMRRSTLPPVFEGANTANLALNFGTIYYHIARRGNESVLYPTRVLESNPGAAYLRRLQDASNQVRVALHEWPTDRDYAKVPPPPQIFAAPVVAYRAEAADGTYRSYFRNLAAFYTSAANDKLSLALSYLSQKAVPAAPHALIEAGNGSGPLDTIYGDLAAAKKNGDLPLVPGGLPPGSQVAQFLASLLPQTAFTLTRATLARDPAEGDPITKVTAAGASDCFKDESDVVLTFTAADGKVETEITWTWKGTGAFPGLAWIQMKDPTLTIAVSEGLTLTHGSISAAVSLGSMLTATLEWRFPTPDDAWLITAGFDPKPSPEKLFALAGGIDLSRLPPPFDVLSQLGLSKLELSYDPKTGTANSLAFSIVSSDPKPVPLIGSISVYGIDIETTIRSPGSLADRSVATQIGGRFNLADPMKDPDYPAVAIEGTVPKLTLSGTLARGKLKLLDVVNAFIPGTPINPPQQPTLTEFSFSYDHAQQATAVALDLNIDWEFTVGTVTPFKIKDVGLDIATTPDQSTGSLSGAITLFPSSLNLALIITSSYATGAGWTFEARQVGDPVKLGLLAKEYLGWDVGDDYGIAGLYLQLSTGDGSWVFAGKTADPWKVPFIDATIDASVRVGYNGTKQLAALHPEVAASTLALDLASAPTPGKFGRVEAEIRWHGIDVKLWGDYAGGVQTYGLLWEGLKGEVSGPTNAEGDWVAALGFTDDVTIGSLIERMVSWMTGAKFGLEAPWSILDDIKLSGLSLLYTFNSSKPERNHVAFKVDIGPIELGFARIDGIEVSYESAGDSPGVKVGITGSFPWNVGAGAKGDTSKLAWDASKPGDAPTPPGQGGKYLDLRFLALGQHVTVTGLTDAQTVQEAIGKMKQLPSTDPGKLPAVTFDATSDWLVGTEFGVLRQDPASGAKELGANGNQLVRGEVLPALADAAPAKYLITLQGVFNDPHLYGLRVFLDGDAAKVFKGLDFQVMYRQLSDSLGVYQAEITLPDVMRHLDVGAASVTLPVFAFAIYTNGDFLIDVGFPKNLDWSRSFTVEMIIAPGIPMLGAGGFYFGKIPEAATTQVPSNPALGTFNPIIVFGFGMQLGFGKSVQYGPLKAGFSLTVFGIVEGIVAKWNPYKQLPSGSGGSDTQLQGAYYFWIQGTVGIAGKLYGSVDFAIIKGQVDVDIKLYIQLTYESFVSLALTVVASVDVSLSVTIDLWLFSITLHFSFSLNIKETFTIKNSGDAPWAAAGAQQSSLLRGPADLRLRASRVPAVGLLAATANVDWTHLGTPAEGVTPLSGYLMTALSVAADERAPADQTRQSPCYVAMLAIDSVQPAAVETQTAALKAAGVADDSSFEKLCKRVLAFVVAAVTDLPPEKKTVTPDEVMDGVVSAEQLLVLLDSVLVSTDAAPTPIPLTAIESFLAGQFAFTVQVAPETGTPPAATSFPVPPGLGLQLPAYKDYPGYAYTFGGYNELTEDALRKLRKDFDALLVKVQSESGGGPEALSLQDGDAVSVGSWLFADFFLLIARQMVQAARAALRTFKYPLSNGAAVNDAIAWITTQQGPALAPYDIIAANATHPLAAGTNSVTIGVTRPVGAAGSFSALSADVATTLLATVSATDLATTNAAAPCLRATAQITYPGKPPYTVQAGDTLIDVARQLDVSLADLLINAGLLDEPALLDPNAVVLIPLVTRQALATDTFTTIATAGGFDPTALLDQNAGRAVLHTGTKVSYASHPDHQVAPAECLGDVAGAFGVTLAQLVAGGTVAGKSLLDASGLLAPLAVLALPSFAVEPKTGDTLQALAARFGTTLAVLGDQPANGTVRFADTDGKTAAPYLDVAHLDRLRLGALVDEAQRSHALQHLSGMASRYQLHGLRLRTDGITPSTPGMWVENDSGKLTLPPEAGLHALSGQQFPLPTVTGTDTFTITFQSSGGEPWLKFADGGGNAVTQLEIDITAASRQAVAIQNLADWAHANRLDVPATGLGPASMYRSDPARYPFSSSVVWQALASVTLPYGKGEPSDPAVLRLWPLPDALLALPDLAKHAVDPRMSVAISRYDEATGATSSSGVSAYGWASRIGFTVKRVPPVAGSPASATTYEIVGAGAQEILLLERLLEEVGSDDTAFASVTIGFAPDATGGAAQGIQTDDPAQVTSGIAQVNLSTETRPAALAAFAEQAATAPPGQSLNKPSEVVKLLWEASVTRSGGFYLYYFDAGEARGLPDRIFDDRGQAQLSLLVLYSNESQNHVADYMNTLVTGVSIEGTGASLYAESDPPTGVTVPDANVSLGGLAEAYFSDVGDLAAANAGLALRTGVKVYVSEGVFQAPPQGINLADVATQFGTTEQLLNDANPLWKGSLPATLTFPLAIRLPALTLTAGTNPSSGTLAAIAGYYGEDLTALGADNAAVAGLFADSQQIVITGGPYVRTPTVPPGAAAYSATRPVPDPIPADPTNPDFTRLFLLRSFALLGYRIADSVAFAASPIGIPAGPTVPPADSQSGDKLRTAQDDGGIWTYAASVPYNTAVKPPAVPGTYAGVGDVLQVSFEWLDHFGNRIVTVLSDPTPSDLPPRDQPPLLAGYSDALIGLGRWPGTASTWQVAGSAGDAKAEIDVTFDANRYAGLIEAEATDATTVRATFTEAVDAATARDPGNYKLDHGTVTAAVLASDGVTVTLTVDALPQGQAYTVTVSRVLPVAPPPNRTFHGTAGFTYPDDPHQRSSTVQQRAQHDALVYARLLEQLRDPNGIALAVESTLVVDDHGQPVPQQLTSDQVIPLLAWLDSIAGFVTDRAHFQTAVLAPADPQKIHVGLTPLNPAQVFELSLSFSIARTGGVVLGDLDTAPGVRATATTVAPLQQADGDTTRTLAAFAKSFQDVLSQPGQQLVKVATGVDRGRVAAGDAGATLWAVRVGVAPGQPISYAITKETEDAPTIFAPRPAAHQLQSHTGIEIFDYTTGSGLSPQKSFTQDFSDIDMDVWCRQLFAAFDAVLSPRYTAAMQIVAMQPVPDGKTHDWLGDLLTLKRRLAEATQGWMIAIFKDQKGADAGKAQAAYLQQLLSRLSNAYATRAAVGFEASVTANVDDPLGVLPPNLYGAVTASRPALESATTDPSNLPRTVWLRFTDPLDPATAETAANYTVSSGLDVQSATLSPDDGTLVTLVLSDAPAVGASSITVLPAVVTKAGAELRQPATRLITEVGAVDPAAALTFSSPKLPLDQATAQALTFLVSGPDVVLGAGGEVLENVELDLTYAATAIEHQIGKPMPGGEYRPSSWLAFVKTDDLAPLDAVLGRFPLPLPLRAFPASPALTVQTGAEQQSSNGKTTTEIGKHTRWRYEFTFTLPYHYQQDRVLVTVEFNVRDNAARAMAGGPEGAFAQLAQFVTVFPAVAVDLDGILATIDAETDPKADAKRFQDAAIALQAFTKMVTQIADATGPEGIAAAAVPARLTGAEGLGYSFAISETSGTAGTTQDALIVVLVGTPPDGIGTPSVLVDPTDYHCVLQPAALGDAEGTYRFAYRKLGGGEGDYLLAKAGQTTPARTVVLPDMDVLKRQDAWSTAKIERNRFLVSGRESAQPFIYTTGDVTFPNPLHPTIDSSDPVDVAAIGASGPVPRSLSDHLGALFAALLFDSPGKPKASDVTVQVEAVYRYPLNAALDPVPLPVLMQPPLTITLVAEAGKTSLDDMVAQWVAAIELWFESNVPLAGGNLGLDLTIMSNLTQHPMPLLRLRQLYLPVAYVVDPPLSLRTPT